MADANAGKDRDEEFSGEPLTEREIKEVRASLEARKFQKKLSKMIKTTALYVGALATAFTVGWPLIKDFFKFMGRP